MSNSKQNSSTHIKLFIPGPTEVMPDILAAQTEWMIGHRMPESLSLFGRIQPKLRKVFRTNHRVYITASSGSGFWEAAIRNTVNKKVLNCVNGAFSDRWREVSQANGKANDVLNVEWGQPIPPDAVAARLATGEFDAVTIVHNETSTGVTSDVEAIARAIRALPNGEEIMILVDSVSGMSGARVETDAWDLDVVLSASQKAFALPAGLAFGAVSDRALEKARSVPNRGFYFDFLQLEKYIVKDQTPATPALSLLFALDKQLDNMMAETMEGRWARHIEMRDMTLAWVKSRGFEPYAAPGAESPTVTNVHNNLNIDISALNQYLRTQNMIISNGYGAKLKGKAFRIAHMGDLQPADMKMLYSALDAFLDQ